MTQNPILLGADGRPLPSSQPVNPAQEYTTGNSSSLYAGINTWQELQRLHGDADDMDLRLGWEAKEQMDNDPTCAAALDTLALGATARPMEIEPAPKSEYRNDGDEERADEVAAFLRRAMAFLKASHRDPKLTCFTLLRNAMKIGHAKAEICDDLVHGGPDNLKRMVTKVKSKGRKTSCFVVDAQNNVVYVAGFTGKFSEYAKPELNLGGYMMWDTLQQSGWELLPRDKWLVVTNRPPDDESPLGTSLYRRVYTDYRCKRDARAMHLKALDNTAMPHTVAFAPDPASASGAPTFPLIKGQPSLSAEKVPAGQAMYQALMWGRQAGISVLPFNAKVEQLYNNSSGDPFASAFSFWDAQITLGILLQALATGTAKHMARSAGEVHQDILDLAMRHFRHLICECWTRDVLQPMVIKNFPKEYWHLSGRASFGEVELNDFAAWAEAFSKLARDGLLLPSQFPHIWAVLGLPQGDMKELIEQLKQDDAVMEQIMASETDPVTGEKEPGLYEKHTVQETSKRLTRNVSQRRTNRVGAMGN